MHLLNIASVKISGLGTSFDYASCMIHSFFAMALLPIRFQGCNQECFLWVILLLASSVSCPTFQSIKTCCADLMNDMDAADSNSHIDFFTWPLQELHVPSPMESFWSPYHFDCFNYLVDYQHNHIEAPSPQFSALVFKIIGNHWMDLLGLLASDKWPWHPTHSRNNDKWLSKKSSSSQNLPGEAIVAFTSAKPLSIFYFAR